MYTAPDNVRSLSNVIKKLSTLTDAAINEYIAKAQARIDGYLARRYRTPLSEPVPEIISSIAADMAGSFILDEYGSERVKDQTSFAEVLMRRAEKDLQAVVEDGLIDREPGVALAAPARTQTGPAVATTTPAASPFEEVLKQW